MATLSWEDPHQYERVAWLAPFTGNLGGVLGKGSVAGAFDALNATFPLYFAYGVSKLLRGYTGNAFEALRTSDSARQSFAPRTTCNTLATWAQAAGPCTPYATVPFDQSGNAHDGTDVGSLTVSPELVVDLTTYPRFKCDAATGRRWSFTGLKPFTNGRNGVTVMMNVKSLVTAQAASSFIMMFTQNASGSSSRVSLDVTGTGPFSYNARGSRTDATQVSAAIGNHDTVTWRRLILVNDWVNHSITGILDGVRIAQTTLGATLPGGIGTDSAAVFIGGGNTTNNWAGEVNCAAGVTAALDGIPASNGLAVTGSLLIADQCLQAAII